MCVQLTPEQIAHELHMEKILVMFSLLLFSTWSFYFVRLKSAFSNNKKPYRGQSRVLPLILITNLYSKFQRVFCPDSLDVRYTHRHPVRKSFRPRCSWTLHSSLLRSLSSWQMGVARRGVTMTVKWMLKFLSDRRLQTGQHYSQYSVFLAGWLDPPCLRFTIICYSSLSRGNSSPYSRGESLIRIKSSLETEGDTDVIQQSHAISIQRGGNSNGNQSLTLDFYNWNL